MMDEFETWEEGKRLLDEIESQRADGLEVVELLEQGVEMGDRAAALIRSYRHVASVADQGKCDAWLADYDGSA